MTGFGVPALFTVDLSVAVDGGRDAHNNVIRSYLPPQPYAVYGWSQPSSGESTTPGQSNRVITDLELLAPSTLPASAHDRVTVEGQSYEVQGDPADYDHGPFAFRPGLVVMLKKVSG